MRIVILNQYYAPDSAATAQLAADLGAELARAGHDVVAIASTRPYAQGGADRLPAREQIDGVEVHRVRATARGRGRRLDRLADYASFYAGAAVTLATLPRPDVIVALTTPPFIATLAAMEGLRRGCRVVLWVMDVYPDVAVALGALPARGIGARWLSALSTRILHGADAIVALDDAMRDRLVARGAAPDRITVIDNWWDGVAVVPKPSEQSSLRQGLDCGDRLLIGYFGNLGLGHDFETLLAALDALGEQKNYGWLFVGDGPRRREIEDALSSRRAWYRVLEPRPRAELGDALAAADLLAVTLREGLAGLVAPSKLYAALAAGRPLLYVGPPAGRTAEVVERERVGIGVRNGDATGLVRQLERLRRDRGEREAMGSRARRLFEERFDRSRGVTAHRALLEQVAGC